MGPGKQRSWFEPPQGTGIVLLHWPAIGVTAIALVNFILFIISFYSRTVMTVMTVRVRGPVNRCHDRSDPNQPEFRFERKRVFLCAIRLD
jgi:hypothetical protein